PKDSSAEWPTSVHIGQHAVGSSVGIIDPNRFLEELQKERHNEDVSTGILRRTLTLEFWLRHLSARGILTNSTSTKGQEDPLFLRVEELRAPDQPKSSAS